MRFFLLNIAARRCSTVTNTGKVVRIGGVRAAISNPKRPELVPAGYAGSTHSQSSLRHLKWLLQKDNLNQDVFLMGVPGVQRSQLVLQYLELCNREYEYLVVTRDTTEADIKQRREIRSGNAYYTDLCAVRAALNGRVLVIDGVEKAERNVLPILNNLLENREMQLDDGRFLMHHEKYDKLKEKYSKEELKTMGLERVSEAFHVIALGLPVPRFPGHTLDPPLRSRFQCRNVLSLPFDTTREMCAAVATAVSPTAINDLVSMVYAVNHQDEIRLPLVPIDNLAQAMQTWNTNPLYSAEDVLRMIYPLESALKDNELKIAKEFIQKFGVTEKSSGGGWLFGGSNDKNASKISNVKASGDKRTVEITVADKLVTVETSGRVDPNSDSKSRMFIGTKKIETLLADLAIAHSQGDFALLGAKGAGKTMVINELAARLGFRLETMVLYQDMNARELIQRRRMLENGDTIWEDSQLVTAAKQGHVCVLDGADRVHWSALESLSPLTKHRRLDLPDGGRLLGQKEFGMIMEKTAFTEAQLNEKNIFCIPESFRLLLVGDSENGEHRWLNEAVLALMPFRTLQPLTVDEQCFIIESLTHGNRDTARKMVELVDRLRNSHDAGLRGVAQSLSLRKILHIEKRDSLKSGELRSLIEKAALARFLPTITKNAFATTLNEAGIVDQHQDDSTDVKAELMGLRRDIEHKGQEAMIPDVLFYDNAQHASVMRDMARDFSLGAHLLLIGNQGVGKNKITDRFLHLINRPRQYIQLHRDTTVESLTIQTCVENGRLRHEDSALVKAARSGQVLVVDEADKAPLHVIAVLKSLLDSGTLLLGDGRRIEPMGKTTNERSVPLHPEFRILMLANRPGFPFLGNDLFGVLGDLFSVHTVDNPSKSSELEMLKKYAPNMPDDNLLKLVAAFSELRALADEGLLQYPYSTREIVNIVKHVEKFPSDPLTTVVKNVFDFDNFSEDAMKIIEEVFQKHGIPLGIDRPHERVFLSQRHVISPMKELGEWGVRNNVVPTIPEATQGQLVVTNSRPSNSKVTQLAKEHMRSTQFTEQECYWQLPLLDTNICSDGIMVGENLVVAAMNPSKLYIIPDMVHAAQVEEINISDLIRNRSARNRFEPRVRLAALGNNRVLIHEEINNTLLALNLKTKEVEQLSIGNSMAGKLANLISTDDSWRMTPGARPFIFERNGHKIVFLHSQDDQWTEVAVERNLRNVLPVTDDKFLLQYEDGGCDLMCFEGDKWLLRPIDESFSKQLSISALRSDGKEKTFMTADGYFALNSNGFPILQMSTSLMGSEKPSLDTENVVDPRRPYYLSDDVTKKFLDPNRNLVLMDGGVLVSTQPRWAVPKHALGKDIPISRVAGFLEAVDPENGFVQYVAVPEPKFQSYHGAWLGSISKTPFVMVPWSKERMLTVDSNGGIRSFELSPATLGQSFQAWKQMVGDNEETLRLEMEQNSFDPSKLDEPKLGKFDPNNAPHHGGNTWMGGTGGYNTAGLGGVGGPFRLDAGHDVHQMSEAAKQQVPEHILRKAREIAKAEYQKKLKEIKMSEYDADAYDSLWNKIERQSERLRSIIEQLESKKKERQWVRHQTSGDLDDGKLIEGVTGEKNIYRRRMDKVPEPGTAQEKPKHLRLCFDVSGSMYRFNGYDKRLQKSMEAALMVMTSLEGQSSKVNYEIVGHSGDGPCTQFVDKENYPQNNKQRLDILKQMLAHTQYCASGDFTVEALDCAIQDMEKDLESDEKIVVLVSDANLERYGIKPKDIVRVMNKADTVNSFVILIGSLGPEADLIQKALPAGKAFVCKSTTELPQIMQNIFASTII